MPEQEMQKRPTGRPPLDESMQSRVLGELGILKPRTPEYRRKRRELAVACDRTERAIDICLAGLKARLLAQTANRKAPDSPPQS